MKFEYKSPWIEDLDLERNASSYFQSMAFIYFLGSSLYILLVRQVNDFLKEPRGRRLGLLPRIWFFSEVALSARPGSTGSGLGRSRRTARGCG